jgi:phytoene desaturase
VTILEKTGQVGGRNRRIKVGTSDFDAGPTLVMMLAPFRKLFADVGETLEDRLELTLCDPGYRAWFADGTHVDTTIDQSKMRKRISNICEHDAAKFPALMTDLKALYEDSIPNFVEQNFYSFADFFSPRQLARVAKHRMLANLGKRIERTFEDPRIRMLFSFQTMYLGLSPFQAPWVYATLAYMEFGEGIWYPKGGVAQISEVVAKAAFERGAEIRLNSSVAKIDPDRVILESGEVVHADAVLCNADLPYARRELVGEPTKQLRNSCSAYLVYADYEGELPELLHHNVFFSGDFHHNLRQIFERSEVPDDPSFYVAVSNKTEPDRAAAGNSNLMVLVPCPNLEHRWTEHDASHLKQRAFERLAKATSFRPDQVRAVSTFGPNDWASELNLDQGAAFGLSHQFRQSAYFRPGNRSKSNPNLYFVGASTVPGNGMPMVLISADLVVQRMKHDGVF